MDATTNTETQAPVITLSTSIKRSEASHQFQGIEEGGLRLVAKEAAVYGLAIPITSMKRSVIHQGERIDG